MIYDIQRYCIHDGRGIRTTIFMKGCQFSCPWCANPESQSGEKEIALSASKCAGCGACERTCPRGAINNQTIDRLLCDLCGACVYACPRNAITIYGRDASPEAVCAEAMRDMRFYRKSGGGVTISGGEPTLQMPFLEELLARLKKQGVHTAIETHGYFDANIRETLIPLTDQFLVDLKHLDKETHERATGFSNEIILENMAGLANYGLSIRIPVIPGYNDSDENMAKCADFASSLAVPVHLLPFHAMAAGKYNSLGRDYVYAGTKPLPVERNEDILNIFLDKGVRAQLGG